MAKCNYQAEGAIDGGAEGKNRMALLVSWMLLGKKMSDEKKFKVRKAFNEAHGIDIESNSRQRNIITGSSLRYLWLGKESLFEGMLISSKMVQCLLFLCLFFIVPLINVIIP